MIRKEEHCGETSTDIEVIDWVITCIVYALPAQCITNGKVEICRETLISTDDTR